MNVISMEEEAFFKLIKQVVDQLKEKDGRKHDKWIAGDEAMQMLRITSKTTLQKLRDEGEIRFTQPMPKLILYDSDSILNYLEKHARGTF